MPKFFVPKENIGDEYIKISGEDVLHIRKVLRMRVGEELTLCDSAGYDYTVKIDNLDEKDILCKIITRVKCDTEPPVRVVLFQGIPKAAKMDYIIQKSTELGVSEIVPCSLARCVAKAEGGKKTLRWQKIAEEAAKQSGRGVIPKVHDPVGLDKAIEMMSTLEFGFVPYECEENTSIKSVLTRNENGKSVGFIIGPEGGFDKSEIDKLESAGITPVSLGKRILRTETAGEAVLAMIMYEIGDINL